MAIEFKKFKEQLQGAFSALIANQTHLFTVDVDKDALWQIYLDSFEDPEIRKNHDCSACRSFVKHYGNIVSIVDGEIKSIWDFQTEAPYTLAPMLLSKFIKASTITNVFFTKFSKLGVNFNTQNTENTGIITWHHMYFELPRKFVNTSSDSIEALMGQYRDNRNVFKRSLEEISQEAVETVLELIAQGSLYRGDESKGALEEFLKYKKAYSKLRTVQALKSSADYSENYTWQFAVNLPPSIAKIRNTAVGTLLTDISEGKELDYAVTAFERMMAPANYKRPTAIVTPRMVEAAEKEITELGLTDSLGRRLATVEDISINNVLFANRDAKKAAGVFAEMKEDALINPKTLTKVEEIGIDDFVKNVLPNITGMELLFENTQLSNLMTLVTAEHSEAPGLFKWPNPFSWSYTNAVTDSIKEQVKAAGGKVEGELRVSLSWNNCDDLDLHIYEPHNHHIYFGDKRSSTGGELDVDMNAGQCTSKTPVENIIWETNSRMKEGTYKVVVNNYTKRSNSDAGFSLEVECRGEVYNFESNVSPASSQSFQVLEFDYTKSAGVKMGSQIKSTTVSKEKWSLATNRFHKVSLMLNSPNYWDDKTIGNKHTFFILEGAKTDEQTRGFFNEFLTDDLIRNHKRVFEVLAGKLKVAPADKELSGLGFSSTQRNSVVVRVQGKFQRLLRINF